MVLGFLVTLVTFPGVIFHEWAHKIACKKMGLEVYEVCYFRLGDPVGYVSHEPPHRYSQSFIIAVAPFLLNTATANIFFMLAIKTPKPISYLFYWLGFSSGMHAYPSHQDAENLWNFTKRVWRRNPLVLFGIPIIALIVVADALRYLWFDFFYALFLLAFSNLFFTNPLMIFNMSKILDNLNTWLGRIEQLIEGWID